MPDDYSYKIAVSGWGTPHPDLIADCLRDRFPHDDGYPCRLLVAAVQERLTTGVQAVIEYAWEAEWTVVAVIEPGPTEGVVGELLADGADDRIMVPPGEITNTIVNELVAALPDSALVIMSAACEFDPETLNLARLCANAGVSVLDLSEGLIEVGDVALDLENDDEPERNPDPAPEEPKEEARPPAPAPVTHVMVPASRWERMCLLNAELAALMQEATGEELPAEPPQEKVHEARHRRVGGRMRTEYWDKEAGQWKPRGRGRLKDGTPTRQVPID